MGLQVRRLGWMVLLASAVGFAAPSGDLRIVEALRSGNRELVRTLISEGVDVNATQADGATALAWAAHNDDLESADLLIQAGANVDTTNDYGVSPLSLACTNGNSAMVAKLLAANANPNSALLSGETALMTCSRTGEANTVRALLARGANVNASETRSGQTALMWAVAEKHPDVVRTLIEHGADVHAHSKGGFTPLLLAARHGDLESARLLLEAGADVNEATPEDGSALVVASGSGHEALAIFLLEKGADPNAADRFGTTALHYAMLKAIAPYQDITSSLSYLSYMFRPNMQELVKALLQRGADPNARLARTPRLPNGKYAMISLAGATPFWLASAVGDVTIMRMLAEKGADPLAATEEKVTPLMAAAGLGRRVNGHMDRAADEEKAALEAVQLAVALGADIHATTETGLTALHGAAYTGADTIVEFLVDKGANVNAADQYGQTALTIAQRIRPPGLPNQFRSDQVYDKTVKLLRDLGATDAPAR